MDEREELLRKDRERERRREELRRKREEEVQKKKRQFLIIGIATLLLIVLGSFLGVQISKKIKADKAAEKARQEKLAKEKEQEENTVHFLAVGDNISHQPIRESGMKEDGVWNYDHVYKHVKKDVEKADLALVTQETVFVKDRSQVSGYPSFGTPVEFGDALVNTGFDVVAHATNHIMDKGTPSVEYTLDWWKENHPETQILGIHENEEAAEEIPVIKCKKLKLAMLDYTYGLNGMKVPSDQKYLVDIFEEDKAREDIRRAKELADAVIVVMHVGNEYEMDVDSQTRQWVNVFLEEGVDIVIGSHPHVVRTMETLTGEDGHKMLVYYSLGNFTSTQNDLPSLLGAMAKITIRKDIDTGEITIPKHEFIPLLMYYDRENPAAGIYKLKDYPDELIEKHSVYEANPTKFSKEYYEKLFEEIENKGKSE